MPEDRDLFQPIEDRGFDDVVGKFAPSVSGTVNSTHRGILPINDQHPLFPDFF